ncbi:TetR family transcriptional regulator [Streptomyces sp. B6B3]|uniref:TetR/AcrR family transcriptional regulator n=1 Tax=Streptomyces sp. B6B3 TaxID=3153570 RepID=UPI00325F55AE
MAAPRPHSELTPGTAADDAPAAAPRRRAAARTRGLLLDSARRRFAHDGYAATTVRDIADDAGVNAALINRYFQSKEGLFEACLAAAIEELGRTASAVSDRTDIAEIIVRQTANAVSAERPRDALLLLLRASGDERTERMRTDLLRTVSERLAGTAGWRPEDPAGDGLLLRAQLILAATFGLTVLRASPGLEPLTSATEEDLHQPLRDLVDALLARR